MPMIEIEESVLEELVQEEENDKYELVEQTPWESEHKTCHSSVILKDKESGKHYRFGITRYGSYYQGYDWEYDPSGEEVESKEVVVKEWVRVKK